MSDTAIRTEADVVRALAGTFTLDELYREVAANVDIARDGGLDEVHPGDQRWKRRVRGVLQNLRAAGRGERVERCTWALQGSRTRPRRMLLILAGGDPADFELRVQDAVSLLSTLDDPADLVVCDPPYALGRGTSRSSASRVYARDNSAVVAGYVDVDPAAYEDFTCAWVEAATRALRPGGQLAVVTGPDAADIVGYATRRSGLTRVATIAAYRAFPLWMSRRPSPAHWVVTVCCNGPLEHPRRVFVAPDDLPAARSGRDYPLDWWPDNGRVQHRGGTLRYDNELPLRLVHRIVRSFSADGEHVVDPCVGSGTTAEAAWRLGRRFTGGDVNPHAIRYTAARLLLDNAWRPDLTVAATPTRPAATAGGTQQTMLWLEEAA